MKNPTGKTSKLKKRRTSLPMRGAVLSDLGTLLRVGDRLRAGRAGGLPEGTARKTLSDQPDVGPEKLAVLAAHLVDEVFPADYLAACGLSGDDARLHNERVVAAVLAVVAKWDDVVAWVNVVGTPTTDVFELITVLRGVPGEMTIRVAAYDALYGDLHPALQHFEEWIRAKGITACWDSLAKRAQKRWTTSTIEKASGVARKTITSVAKGIVPRDDVIARLAKGWAAHEVWHATRPRLMTVFEIDFELRAAAAVAETWAWLCGSDLLTTCQIQVREFQLLRRGIRGMAPDDRADLLVKGLASEFWPAIHGDLQQIRMATFVQMLVPVFQQAEHLRGLLERDPQAALAAITRQSEEIGESFAAADFEEGDGPGQRLQEMMQGWASITSHLANGTPIKPIREGLLEEIRADSLCLNAMDPWRRHDMATRERKFREAVSICPSSAFARRRLGQHLLGKGQREEAVVHLREAVRLKPNVVVGRRLLALALDDGRSAVEILEVLDPARHDPEVQVLMASCLHALDRIDEAEQAIEPVLLANPRHVFALEVMARCKASHGDHSTAAALRKRATHYSNAKKG